MAEWNAARSQSRFGAEVVRHLVAQPVHLRQHEKKLGTDLRGTLKQSSMQQQLQQHPSGEAAAVLMRLTWALSKSFRVPRSCGSKKKSLSSCWRSGRPGSLGATSAAVAAPASCPNLSAPALLVDPPPQLLSRGGREREGHLRRGDVNEQPAVRSVGGSAILSGARRPRGHTS